VRGAITLRKKATGCLEYRSVHLPFSEAAAATGFDHYHGEVVKSWLTCIRSPEFQD
jgi:hypothetical protein